MSAIATAPHPIVQGINNNGMPAPVKNVTMSDYPPLARRLRRVHNVPADPNVKCTHNFFVQGSRVITERLSDSIDQLKRAGKHIILPESPERVRFVAVSDTHGRHELLDLPAGDVLLHAGDLVQNSGQSISKLLGQFKSFLNWIESIEDKFQKIVFIAGNHDTFLEDARKGSAAAKKILSRFLRSHPKVCYLQNGSVEFRGLRIWGAPITPCRVERMNRSFYSNGFETKQVQRKSAWAAVPENVDILLTHAPPSGVLSGLSGDDLLWDCVSRQRPRMHVFGHDHAYFGLDMKKNTLFLNAAQDIMLKREKSSGGTPLIFDLSGKAAETSVPTVSFLARMMKRLSASS